MKKSAHPAHLRMKRLIHFYLTDLTKYADNLNISRQLLSQRLNAKYLNEEFVKQFLKDFPNVNEEWLRLNKGCPFKTCESDRKLKELQDQVKKQEEIMNRLLDLLKTKEQPPASS